MIRGTVAELLHRSARSRPNEPLLIDPAGGALTVAEVARLASAMTNWLAGIGIERGMTVGWQLPSHVPAFVTMLSLAQCDVVQAPLIHIYGPREVAAAVKVADVDVLIIDRSTAGTVPNNVEAVELPPQFQETMSALATAPHPALADRRGPDDPRWVYFTSGTTGRPKGVRHTDATLLTAARGYRDFQGLGDVAGDVGAVCFPVAHIGGIIFAGCALLGRFPILAVPRFDPDDLPNLLARHNVTFTGAGSVFYQLLLSAQLASDRREPLIPSLRLLTGGGAPCPPELHRQVRDALGVPILHCYGMTEAAMACVTSAGDNSEQRANSAGAPIPGAELRITGADDPGADGDVEIRGSNVTPGYLDAEQWAAALTDDGWFRTGDRGHLRADGHLVLTGRSKEIIIRKGENIVPTEVENALLAHPLIEDVAVVGLPDALRGELVCAVVRRSVRHRDVTLDEVCAFLGERGLMKQKWPERLVVVDEFPLTGVGKVAKAELVRRIATA